MMWIMATEQESKFDGSGWREPKPESANCFYFILFPAKVEE